MYNIFIFINEEDCFMKKCKIIALLLSAILLLTITSCNKNDPHGTPSHTNSPTPNQGEDDTVQEGGEGQITYVYSVVQKMLHLPDCYHLDRMNEEYKYEYTGNISELLNNGYTICRDCLVPDTEDEEDEEDEENKIAKEDATFVINSSSFALHKLDCHHIDKMEEKNIKYTDLTLEELIALDLYQPCGFCLPDEYEEYMKNHPKK